MLRVFALDNSFLDGKGQFERWLSLVDGARRRRVNEMTDPRAKTVCLSAGAALLLALEKCGLVGCEPRVEIGERGKPRLTQPAGVFFNLSHSGGYTVVALSDGEVGCDVQQIRRVNLKVAKRWFHSLEADDIFGLGESTRRERFFRYWTAKESFIKATGEGLSRPLDSFFIKFGDGGEGEVRLADGGSAGWRVAESRALNGYCIAVCSQNIQPFEVEILNGEEV